jgi:uncharacterized membrane protein YfcA
MTQVSAPLWRAAVVGLCAGTLSGLFGVGGGFVMVPLFVMWLGVEQRTAHATSLAAITPIAATAAAGYAVHGDVDWRAGGLVLLGSMVGANYGVRLLHGLSLPVIQRGFALLLIATAVRLVWSEQPHQLAHGAAGHALLVVIGLVAGVMAGLFGVGGGIVIVPSLILGAGLVPGLARGTSLAVIIGTSVVGTLAHRRRGTVDDRLALVTGLAGIPAAIVSTYVVQAVPDRTIVAMFAVLLVYTATRMVRTASH